jgi:SAM-dependent methyltransferase
MADAPSQRAQREREAYNQGLRRTTYNAILRHTHDLVRRRRYRLMAELLRPSANGRMLELGSNGWRRILDENGGDPVDLTCINVSEREIEEGIEAARRSRIRPRFLLMDAHRLGFPDACFDAVFGVSILHHLDFKTGLAEIRRVLKPGGLMLFAEPLDNNPVGRLVRALTPHARTPDERPLCFAELALLRRYFDCTFHYEQLLAVPLGLVSGLLFRDPENALTRLALAADDRLLRHLPALGPYCRHVLIVGRKGIDGPDGSGNGSCSWREARSAVAP